MNKAIVLIGLLILVGCSNNPKEKSFDELLEEDRRLHYTGGYCEGFCEAQDLEVKEFNITNCECKDKEPEIEFENNLTLGSAGSIFFNMTFNKRLLNFDYTPNYFFNSMNVNFTFMNMTCHEVRCDCMDWGCMSYCMSCKDLNTSNTEKVEK